MTNDKYYIASSSILRYLNQVSKHNRLTDAQIKKKWGEAGKRGVPGSNLFVGVIDIFFHFIF